MTFKDLPEDWPQMPLTDPGHTADVLDLFVTMHARFEGALFVLVCDEQRRPVQPIQIDQVGTADVMPLRGVLPRVAATIADEHPDATILLALARDGDLEVRPTDFAFQQALLDSFSPHLTVIAVYLVTPDGTRCLQRHDEAA